MKIGDLVKHYDQLYAGFGLVIDTAKCQMPGWATASALVQYGDVTDWISIEDLEIVNASR